MYPTQYGVPQSGIQQVPYGMPGIQAAAMAATAAASGSNYPYMHADPNMSQTSPRMGTNPKKDGRQSPRMSRRMSQVGSPTQTSMMSHNGPRHGVPPSQMPTAQSMSHQQAPDVGGGAVEESPLYVNAKQFHRILKRRVARQRLEEQLRLTSKGRKPYLHESRHNHAMRRPRGPGGRFLTADEVAAMERDGKLDPEKLEAMESNASTKSSNSSKRKSEVEPTSPNKKAKTEADAGDVATVG